MSTKPYTVTLDEQTAEQARTHAERAGMSFSALVNRALREENRRRAADRWLEFLSSGTSEAAEVNEALERARRHAAMHADEKWGHLR
jgi:post-segregation antitoxin (ccd killing protein)